MSDFCRTLVAIRRVGWEKLDQTHQSSGSQPGCRGTLGTFSSYVLALAKDFGAKNALLFEKRVRKMMMKLTPCQNIHHWAKSVDSTQHNSRKIMLNYISVVSMPDFSITLFRIKVTEIFESLRNKFGYYEHSILQNCFSFISRL